MRKPVSLCCCFLDLSYEEARRKGELRNKGELIEAIIHGAVKRVRPKAMTVMAAFMGLMPIMWSAAVGADMMKRVAAPMVGGLATSFALELLVYPSIYYLWKWRAEVKNQTFDRRVRSRDTDARFLSDESSYKKMKYGRCEDAQRIRQKHSGNIISLEEAGQSVARH